MAVVIGELLVNLRASTAAFAKDLDKASQLSFNTAKQIERSFKQMGAAAAAELSAAVTAVSALVFKSIELADQMGKSAEKTGLTVEQFSSLAYAAKIEEVSIQSLSTGLGIMSKNLEKSNEATQAGKAAHSALATLFHGSIPVFASTQEAFLQISTRLAALPEGYQRTALAMQIFGKGGKELLPLILQSGDGIRKLTAEAAELGVVISGRTQRASEDFNETIKKITTVVEALGLRLAEQLLPYFQKLADLFLQSSKNAAQSQATISALAKSVQVLATVVVAVGAAFSVVGNVVGNILTRIDALLSIHKTWAARNAEIASSNKEVADSLKAASAVLSGIWTPAVKTAAERLNDMWKVADAVIKRFGEKGILFDPEMSKKMAAELKHVTDTLHENINMMKVGEDATIRLKLASDGFSASVIAQVKALQDKRNLLKELAKLDDSGKDEKKLLDAKEWLAWHTSTFHVLQMEANLMDDMPDFPAFTAIGAPQQTQAFTEANNELVTSLQHSIAVWGMSAHEVTLYNLALLDSSANAAAAAQKTVALQDKLQHMENVTAAWREFGQVADRALNDLIFSGKKFTDVLKDVVKMIGEMLLKWALFGASGKGGLFGALFSGLKGLMGFASGGPVGGGQPIMVGERGPEIFVPAMSGRIVPNGAIGGGVSVVYNIDARGSSMTEEQIRRAMAESENRAVRRAIGAGREMQLRT